MGLSPERVKLSPLIDISAPRRAVWDILHPGRKEKLGIRVDKAMETAIVKSLRQAITPEQLREAIDDHRKARLAFNRLQKKTPKNLEEEGDD